MKTVLTIAGSDPFGGSGMQADIKTMTAHKVYAMNVVTLLTAQNSLGFYEAKPTDLDLLEKQIDHIFEDVTPDATKTGMLLTSEIINLVADKIKEYKPKNLVIDPVMMSFRTVKLINDDAIKTMLDKLIPLADVITPNWGETEIIADMKIESQEDMITAAKIIHDKYGCAVYTKSGLQNGNADDLLYGDNGYEWIKGDIIQSDNVRGTGCTLSSAISSNLAKGQSILEACTNAKKYVSEAIKNSPEIGKGKKGPINHSYNI